MQNIRDVLNRGNDLSTFVVHLTRDSTTASANQKPQIDYRRAHLAGEVSYGMGRGPR